MAEEYTQECQETEESCTNGDVSHNLASTYLSIVFLVHYCDMIGSCSKDAKIYNEQNFKNIQTPIFVHTASKEQDHCYSKDR